MKRTLLVFVGFAFLALVLTVLYALAGLGGVESVLADAERLLRDGKTSEAVRQLDLVERNLGPGGNRELNQRVLERRVTAHLRLENYQRALADLDRLLAHYRPGDRDLTLDYCDTLIRFDRAEDALQRVLPLLAERPDDGRANELAGAAEQALYQVEVRKLLEALRSRLAPEVNREARDALLPYLYRDAGDPVARQGKQKFDGLLERHRPSDAITKTFEPAIASVRERIRASQRYYLACLESDGFAPRDASAYRGLAYALRQGRRFDDLIGLAELYWRRFADRPHALAAAADLVVTHEQLGRPRAAIEAATRCLPLGSWRERRKLGALDPAVIRRLRAAHARALWTLRDVAGLDAVNGELDAMSAAKIDMVPEAHLVSGLDCDVNRYSVEAEKHLQIYASRVKDREPRENGTDTFAEVQKLRLRNAWRAKEDQTLRTVFDDWLAGRPGELEPYVWRACWHLERDDANAAYADALRAQQLSSQDEQVLEVYAEAANRKYRETGRDAPSLLQQCLTLQTPLPLDLPEDALLLPLARWALRKQQPALALRAAQQAAARYTWARAPRVVWVEAALALRNVPEAVRAAEILRGHHPDDPQALTLLRRARGEARQVMPELLFDVALTTPWQPPALSLTQLLEREHGSRQPRGADPELAAELMRGALARGDLIFASRLAQQARVQFANQPQPLLRVAEIWGRTNRVDDAIHLLGELYVLGASGDRDLAGRAIVAQTRLFAAHQLTSVIDAIVPTVAQLNRGQPERLRGLVADLQAAGLNGPAYALLKPLLREDRYQRQRSGRDFLLGGRLALELDLPAEAEAHLSAALTFDDGRAAALPLTLLLLANGRGADAAEVFWTTEVRDVTTAAVLLRLSRPDEIAPFLAPARRAAPFHVGLLCLAALRDPAAVVPPDVRELAREARAELLDVLVFAGHRSFAKPALRAVAELRARFPDNAAARWLHAHVRAGSGDTEAAITELAALAERDPGDIAAFDELLRLIQETRHPLANDRKLGILVTFATARANALATPRMQAFAMRDVARSLEQVGSVLPAQTLLAETWVRYPVESGAGPAEVQRLLATERPARALDLVDALAATWSPADTRGYLQLWVQTARQLAPGADDALQTRLRLTAQALLERHGAQDGLVHFVLDAERARGGAGGERRDQASAERSERERKLLLDHLATARPGADAGALVETFRRLREHLPLADLLPKLDEILRRDPSSVELWLLRGQLLEEQGHTAEAIASVRWLEDYASEPQAALAAIRIAASAGQAPEIDLDRLYAALGPRAGRTPPALWALGLLALRQGRYFEADQLLANAAPSADGAHLFLRALANLALPGHEPGGRARSLFSELAARYPSSSFAENAGHFAAQLGLAASAAPIPAK